MNPLYIYIYIYIYRRFLLPLSFCGLGPIDTVKGIC